MDDERADEIHSDPSIRRGVTANRPDWGDARFGEYQGYVKPTLQFLKAAYTRNERKDAMSDAPKDGPSMKLKVDQRSREAGASRSGPSSHPIRLGQCDGTGRQPRSAVGALPAMEWKSPSRRWETTGRS